MPSLRNSGCIPCEMEKLATNTPKIPQNRNVHSTENKWTETSDSRSDLRRNNNVVATHTRRSRVKTRRNYHLLCRTSSAVNTLAILAILATMLIRECSSIQCYECVHNSQRMKRQQRYVYPCLYFDGSDRFIRNCPDSQLCVYQHITLALATGPIKVHTMDGCTPNATQLTRYSEAGLVKAGCIQHLSRYKPPSSIYCYCDQDLCNGRGGAPGHSTTSPRHHKTILLILTAVLTLL